MWIINNVCRDRSTTDKRVLNFNFHIAGNNGDGIFTSLRPYKWYPKTKEEDVILLEFESINEIKNIIYNLQKIIDITEQAGR